MPLARKMVLVDVGVQETLKEAVGMCLPSIICIYIVPDKAFFHPKSAGVFLIFPRNICYGTH